MERQKKASHIPVPDLRAWRTMQGRRCIGMPCPQPQGTLQLETGLDQLLSGWLSIHLPPTCGPHASPPFVSSSSRLFITNPRAVASPAFSKLQIYHLLPRFLLTLRPLCFSLSPSASGRMAKGGLGKLRCMVRRWHSSGRIVSRAPPSPLGEEGGHDGGASFHGADEVPKGLHPVYVGKSRRRYLVAGDIVGHPLFQTLVHRTGGGAETGCTVVGCEVVLFEHLLWMLENADPQPESLDELVEYYAC
ncbi:unnamed protein product [Urochloa humidicola]